MRDFFAVIEYSFGRKIFGNTVTCPDERLLLSHPAEKTSVWGTGCAMMGPESPLFLR
jgi:hypothetical protein